jgi:uncharacterized protein DUF6166
MGKIYRGHLVETKKGGRRVTVEQDGVARELPARYGQRGRAVVGHSPCGFMWGYGGSGPAQLAFAICLDILGDADDARSVYQQFKWNVIAGLDQFSPFEIHEDAARKVLNSLLAEREAREPA